MEQNRRTLLKTAAALASACGSANLLAQQSEEQPAANATAPVTVPAGKSRNGDPLRMIDRETVSCKLSGSDTNGQSAIFETVTEPGAGSSLHLHPDQDEWWYVLTGEFLFEVGSAKFHLQAGDSLFGPRGTPHGFRNLAPTPGKLLIVFQPAGKIEEFYAAYAKFRVLPPHRVLRMLYSQYGMQMVGPLPSAAPPAS